MTWKTECRLLILALAGIAAFWIAVVVFEDRLRLLVENAKGGCFPWSPAVVEYHEGMTLCPGQSVIITIKITPDDGSI